MKRLMKSKKAVSPVIAVILLIAIAVAASVTVFAYTQGILTGVTQANLVMSNGQRVNNRLITVTIQNTGGTSTTISAVDVQGNRVDDIKNAITGELYDSNGDSGSDTGILLGAGDSVTIEIHRDAGIFPTSSATILLWVDGNDPGDPVDYSATFQF